jgi:hypothetical protein
MSEVKGGVLREGRYHFHVGFQAREKKAEWQISRASAIYRTNRHSLILFGNVEILKEEQTTTAFSGRKHNVRNAMR